MNLKDARALKRGGRTSRDIPPLPVLTPMDQDIRAMNLNPPVNDMPINTTGQTRSVSGTVRGATHFTHPALNSALGMLLPGFVPMTFAAEADDILGEWVSAGGHSRIEIFKRDEFYYGRLGMHGDVGHSPLGRTTHWERSASYRERELEFIQARR